MKDLPIGVQDFQEIIEGKYLYVDKTQLILKLIQKKGCYFLSRPRRFGKTLLIETLKSIFQGEKELFHGYQIAHTDYSWEKHPVIHLDFALPSAQNTKALESGLHRELINIESTYGIPSKDFGSAKERLIALVRALSQENEVVILIDEYDKPIVDNLHRIEVAEANRDHLRDFFGALKSLHKALRFVFITGISKFTQGSLFSGLNNIADITMEPPYEELLGYTEEEIRLFFRDYLMKIVEDAQQTGAKTTLEELLERMRKQYNGYRFSSREITLYNPYSVMNFLKKGKLGDYWFRTGTPSFFIEHIKKHPLDLIHIRGAIATGDDLRDIPNLREIDQIALMWQTGYLTIQEYNPLTEEYRLDFPNKEVREAFFQALMKDMMKFNARETSIHAKQCRKELEEVNLFSFFERVYVFIAKLPHNVFIKGIQEGAFHAFFLLLLEAMGIRVYLEAYTERAGLSIELPNLVYIFEFTYEGSQNAFSQIEEKRYVSKYLTILKDIVAVDARYSAKTRNISSWQATIYNTKGVTVKKPNSLETE